MCVAKHDRAIFVRKLRSTLRERMDVMHMQDAPAASCQARESALSVGREDARAIVAPGLGVV